MIISFLVGLAVGAILQNKLRNWTAKQKVKFKLPPQFDEAGDINRFVDSTKLMNKKLLEVYELGFDNELKGIENDQVYEGLEARAYSLGKIDAIVGDDVRSVDYQSDETILHQIHNK